MTLDIYLPFYGDPDHFKQAVRSILEQDDPEWRLTIIDDVYPSTQPGEWAAAIDDDRVRYLRNETNLGVSRNYLKCVDMMSEPYAVIMGCDDVMLPGYVGRIRMLQQRFPGCSMIQTGVEVIDAGGKVYLPLSDRVKEWFRLDGNPPREYRGESAAANLLRANWTYFPSICWRVEEIRRYGFRQDLNVVQDLQMILTILRGGGSLVVDSDINFQYRRHSQSVSSHTAVDGSRFEQEATVFSEAAQEMTAKGWPAASRAARLHLTSRLNALTQLPAAVRSRSPQSLRTLTRHAFGGGRPRA